MKAWLLAALLVAPSDAETRANEAYAAGDFEAAIEALEEAYELDPDPRFIFARGSAYQELGRCDDAIVAYEEFLATAPPKDQAQKAYGRIQTCRAELEEEPEPDEPEPIPQPEPEPEPEPPAPADTDGRRWHRDPIGGALLGTGLAVAATGGALIGVGANRRLGADDGGTEGTFRDDLRSSNTLQGVGIGLAVGGGALVVGAVIRYVLVARRSPGQLARRRRWIASTGNPSNHGMPFVLRW